MMRVCVVAPAFMTGGQATEARALLTGFAGDPDVCVIIQPIDPPLPRLVARVPALRTLARMPIFWAGLIRNVAAADVVHVFTAAFWPFVLTTTPAILAGRLFGKPVILNYRDGRAATHIRSRAVRWILKCATALVFPSTFLRDVFRAHGMDGEVIPNVVDTTRFRYRERVPLRPLLISNRLLEPLYAVEDTIRAFALVRRARPTARLMVLGGGHQEAFLRDLVRQEGIEGVEFHGAVSHEAVAAWFDRADIFVNSSREDNMPHSIIEAFSSGLAVVTTRAGGIPYIVEHERNGLLIEVDCPQMMAAAVTRLLDDETLASKVRAEAQRDCQTLYSWSAASRQWRSLYKHLPRAGRDAASERTTEHAT